MSRPPFSELKLYNWSRPDTVGHAVVNLVPSCNLGFTFFVRFSPNYPVGFLDFFQFPPASAAHCKAQLSIFAQVDSVGNAWVAGDTRSNANAGKSDKSDIFLMKFDAQGVHLWTRQRGSGEGLWDWADEARALQADGVRRCFSCDIFHGEKLQNPLGGRCSESCGVASPLKWINLLCAFIRFDISYLVKCLMEV